MEAGNCRKLLLVTRNYPPAQGGIETMARELVAHGSRIPDLKLILAHMGVPKASCRERRNLHACHSFPVLGRLEVIWGSCLVMPWLIFRHRPDKIIHLQVTTAFGTWLVTRFTKTPYYVVGLGLELLQVGHASWWNWLRRRILQDAEVVISISRFTDGLVGRFDVPSSKRSVVPPGTETKPAFTGVSRKKLFPGAVDGDFICFTMCRLVERKGIDTVLRAMAKLESKVRYFIGGDGPDRERLERLTSDLGIAERVHFLGRVADNVLNDYYREADLFLMMSRESRDPPDAEGFGIVFLEAAACGTPAVAGKSGGIPDAVLDGRTGFLVDPEDVDQLAAKVQLLMTDRELLRRMGNSARERVRAEFSWATVCEGYYRVMKLT